jgi:hypothetical protein
VSIADALCVTTDNLFGRETTYEKDIYHGLIKLIEQTPYENQMEKARAICWQTEKGLFGGVGYDPYKYYPDELKNKTGSSYVTRDTGFTSISNRPETPFFSLFTEPAEGFDTLKQYSERFRELFEALGDEYVIKSFFNIYSKPYGYMFEKEVLAEECGIPDDRIDDVMAKLSFAAKPKEITINGEKRVIYAANHRHELIAMLAMITEFFYATGKNSGYNLQANGRSKPYFTK